MKKRTQMARALMMTVSITAGMAGCVARTGSVIDRKDRAPCGPSDTTRTCGTDVGECVAGAQTCSAGVWGDCQGEVGPTAEVCDGLDNDCDGEVDNGNPGGGEPCSADLGSCIARTDCVAGTLVCRGTFVAPPPLGTATNPGTQDAPLSTINAAMANAALLGGGTDVCVCDPPAAGETSYPEDVTMVEGTSILGGYRCDTWARDVYTFVTTVQNQSDSGLKFPAGTTAVTALDGMKVLGADSATTSIAISVIDSSPTLIDVTAAGGLAPAAYGLHVTRTGVAAVAPTIVNSWLSAMASGGGTQVGAYLSGAAATITGTRMEGRVAGGLPPSRSTGLYCVDCAGTVLTASDVSGGSATDVVEGLYATGNSSGFVIEGGTLSGGSVSSGGVGYGGRFDQCTGAPALTGAALLGGSGPSGKLTALGADGPGCTPAASGGTMTGCGPDALGADCIGVACSNGAPCSVTGAGIVAAAMATSTMYAVRCESGGCTTFNGNIIQAGVAVDIPTIDAATVFVSSSSPTFDDNDIAAPGCQSPGNPFFSVFLGNSAATLTNNIIRDAVCAREVSVVHFVKVKAAGLLGPIIHSNTIEYSTCTACGPRRGLAIADPGDTSLPAAGEVRNNIIRNLAAGGTSWTVYEYDAYSDLAAFENNDLYDPTGTLYWDEGTTALTLADVNVLAGASKNIAGDPQLSADHHLLNASPCRNAGSSTGAPDHDFDGQPRPAAGLYDIGADESQ